MNKLEGVERMRSSTPFFGWTRLSLDERLKIVVREYGNYPLPVSRHMYKLDELKGMVKDFLANGRSALIIRERLYYSLYSEITAEHCNIIYPQVHSKFKKTPPKENYICEIINKELFVHNREYFELVKRVFDEVKVSFYGRIS